MKTLRILSCLVLIAVASKAQIPNASFENWYTSSSSLEYLTGWMTSDSLSRALAGGPSAFKGTDAYDGTLSLHLTSVNAQLFNIKGPGVATNGIISLSGTTFVFSGGSPSTVRARFLTGYYKYNPTNVNDRALITIALLRNNAGVRDTIAVGIDTISGPVTTYTPFTTMLFYKDYINNPDTCLIILQSSMAINDPNLGVGSEFIVDSLNFSGTVGIEEASDVVKSLNVYPSPAQNQLHIAVELRKKVNMNCNIYDLTGKRVMNIQDIEEKQSIDISSLAKGNYILKLTDENNNALSSRNFVKE